MFNENVCIITGASRGIGRALALQLADHGAWLSLSARNMENLEQVKAECEARGAKVIIVQCDVSIQADCQNLIEQTVNTYGRIDSLVNNAGITMWAKFDEVEDLSMLSQIMQVNYMGSVYCTHYALPYLKSSKGRLVGISSLSGKVGVPTRSGYAASKHAMAGFFDTLRIELMETGVSVTMIYPGFVNTEIRERAFDKDGQPLGTSPVQESKVMTADECAEIILGAMQKRKREVIMTLRGKIGMWLKLIAPKLIDRIANRAIEKGR